MPRSSRLVRLLLSVAATAAVSVGPPLLLLRGTGTPVVLLRALRRVRWTTPDSTDLRAFLVALLAMLCWAVWARLCVALVIEAVCAGRRRSAPRFRSLGAMQTLAAVLVGGIALVAAGSASSAASTPRTVAVAVRPAGLELAWAEAAFLAAGAVTLAVLLRRGRLRRVRTRGVGIGAPVEPAAAPASDEERRLRSVAAAAPMEPLRAVWSAVTSLGVEPAVVLVSADGDVATWVDSTTAIAPAGAGTARRGWWEFPSRWRDESGHQVEHSAAAVTSDPVSLVPPLVHVGRSGPDDLYLSLRYAQALDVRGAGDTVERVRRAVALSVEVASRLHPSVVTRGDAPDAGGVSAGTGVCWLGYGNDGWMLEPFGLTLVPVGLERHEVAAVRALLERAEHDDAEPFNPPSQPEPSLPGAADPAFPVPAPATPGPRPPAPRSGPVLPAHAHDPVLPPPDPSSRSAQLPEPVERSHRPAEAVVLAPVPDWAFMVRVLGPVDVLGRDGSLVVFERSKSLEFLVWVVLHRRSATREAARTALWESEVRDSSFANVVSEARRALTRHCASEDGGEWLGRPHGELIPLHPQVVSDVEVFRAHVARAETLRRHERGPVAVAAELRAALDLVRGAPFIGSGFGWADAEASTSNFTLLVVAAALELGELELASGQVEQAFHATSIGLSVLPGHEELVALRLRTHARQGDIAGIRHEWHAYQRSLANDPWQSEPSPWLDELVRGLIEQPVGAS